MWKSSLKKKIEKSKNNLYGAKLTSEDDEKANSSNGSVHIFNMTFWPLTEPPHEEDPSTVEHDPYLNNFDVAQNSRYNILFLLSYLSYHF